MQSTTDSKQLKSSLPSTPYSFSKISLTFLSDELLADLLLTGLLRLMRCGTMSKKTQTVMFSLIGFPGALASGAY